MQLYIYMYIHVLVNVSRDLLATAMSWSIQWAGSCEAEGKAGREASRTRVVTYLTKVKETHRLTHTVEGNSTCTVYAHMYVSIVPQLD